VRFCLALDAKNVGVVLRDADLEIAASECALGALSYNGQRCTALKLLLVHKVRALCLDNYHDVSL
jgi:glyceraldehyde-3-phosphate dehydrogenase (NADP+)